jgi:catechol-2,3-dioxygenase
MDTPLQGFSHFQLRVRDVGASRDWYSTVLGIEPYRESDDGTYVALMHRSSHLVVVISSRIEGAPEGAADVPLDHLAFAVPDEETLRLWADHLAEAGIAHPGVAYEEGRPTLQLVDPDGISIELTAPAPRR